MSSRQEREEIEQKYGKAIMNIMDDRTVTSKSMPYYDAVVELGLITESSSRREVKSAKNFVKRVLKKVVQPQDPRILCIPVTGGGWRLIKATKREHIQAKQDWLHYMADKLNTAAADLEPIKKQLQATPETPQEKFQTPRKEKKVKKQP